MTIIIKCIFHPFKKIHTKNEYYQGPNNSDVTINHLRVTIHASLSLLGPSLLFICASGVDGSERWPGNC